MKKFAKILLGIVALLVLAGYAVFQLPAFGGRFEGARLERMQRSPEFIDGRFQNRPPQKTGDSFWETIRLYRQGQIREPRFEIPQGPCLVFRDPGGQRLAVYERVRPQVEEHFEGRMD